MKQLLFGAIIALGAAAPDFPAQAQARYDGNYELSPEDCIQTVISRLEAWRPGRRNVDTRCGGAAFPPNVPCRDRVCVQLSDFRSFSPETREKADCLVRMLKGLPPILAFGGCQARFPGYRIPQ